MKTMPTDLLKKKLKKGEADQSHQWHDYKDSQMFLFKHECVEMVHTGRQRRRRNI